jgi:hypothetical protein
MAMKESHEELKNQTSQAFDDARRLQERWHAHTEPMQAEVYKVGLVLRFAIRPKPMSIRMHID